MSEVNGLFAIWDWYEVDGLRFEYRQIVIRDGKGKKDRVVPLPERMIEILKAHLKEMPELHRNDLENGGARFIFLMLLPENIPARPGNGAGSMCFPAAAFPLTREAVKYVAITSMRMDCRKR